MRVFDIGANLTDGTFKGFYHGKHVHANDLKRVLERSKMANINKIMITSGTLKDLHESKDLIHELNGYQGISLSTTIGVHPTRCMELERDPEMFPRLRLEASGDLSGLAAVGEIGLDYDRLQFCPKDIQIKWFKEQLVLAETTGLPLFLHMRAASDDFLQIVRENKHRFAKGGVVHSFTGTAQEAQAILAEGLFIGLNGASLRTAESLDVVKGIPLDRIMVESDAPWCDIRKSHASHPLLGTSLFTPVDKIKYDPEGATSLNTVVKSRNEPYASLQVLQVLASLHGRKIEEIADLVYETSCKLLTQA